MSDREAVPEADAGEQEQERDRRPATEPEEAPESDELPAADAWEQAQVIEERQTIDRPERPSETPEADWLEQSVAEPAEDDRR